MKSFSVFLGTLAALSVATTGTAFAAITPLAAVPEPGSLALVGLAIGALVLVARKKK
jgi:hypothetical protein